MRAVTLAAAGAAVIGSVSATSHVKHMHAKHHANLARDNWLDWNATSATTSLVVEAETTTSSTTSVEVAATTDTNETWGDWTSTSSTVEEAEPTATETVTWADWTSTEAESSSTVTEVSGESSTSILPTVTITATWTDWVFPTELAATTSEAAAVTTETWSDWTSATSEEPAATTSEAAAVTTETWGDWTSEETTTITLESTLTTTKYIQPFTTASNSSSWANATSTIVPGAAWTAASGTCAITIITSYGPPTWYPTPVAPASTTSAANTTSYNVWGDWTTTTTSTTSTTTTTTTTTTTPVAAVSTSSSTTSTTPVAWADWTSTTAAAPALTSSTETSAEWTAVWTESAAVTVSTESAIASASVEGGSWGWPAPSGSASVSVSVSASASASVSQPTESSSSHGGSPGIVTNGNSWGLTYSPYTASGGCKDAGTISADLAIIAGKGFTSVRVYSTDCSTLENVGSAARSSGLKIILGVWISSSGISGATGQVEDIVAWAQWDLVELIVVGNEAVFNGYASASELAGFVSSSASSFKSAGYTGLITLTEPLSVWQDTSSSSAFCSVVDVVSANLYAFFNADVSADKAGSFIQSEIDILDGICSGKAVYVLESGWPSAGDCNGLACPSPENQATALKGIQATVGAQVIFLSYEDEPWKEPGQFDVEQHWGCASVF